MKIIKEKKTIWSNIKMLIKTTCEFKEFNYKINNDFVFGLLVEPHNREATFFLLFNLEMEGSRI